jgi:hypothetical protein
VYDRRSPLSASPELVGAGGGGVRDTDRCCTAPLLRLVFHSDEALLPDVRKRLQTFAEASCHIAVWWKADRKRARAHASQNVSPTSTSTRPQTPSQSQKLRDPPENASTQGDACPVAALATWAASWFFLRGEEARVGRITLFAMSKTARAVSDPRLGFGAAIVPLSVLAGWGIKKTTYGYAQSRACVK